MNTDQLLEQIYINRDLMMKRNSQALAHFDMLQQTYKHLINDEVAVNLALGKSLIELNFRNNYTAALDNSIAALDKYRNLDCKDVLALHMKLIGHCYAHTGEFDLAERYLLEAMDTVPETDKNYNSHRADVLHELAMAEEFKDDTSEKIIAYLTEAIELLKDEQFAVRVANCRMGLGNAYNNMEKVQEALKNYQDAAETFENEYALLNMASAYSNIGNCYIKLKDFEQAERFHEKALQLRIKYGSHSHISISYYNMAVLYKERKEFDRSEEFLLKTLQIVEELGNKPFVKQINDELDSLIQERKKLMAH